MPQADGSIIIDTRINNKGAEADLKLPLFKSVLCWANPSNRQEQTPLQLPVNCPG